MTINLPVEKPMSHLARPHNAGHSVRAHANAAALAGAALLAFVGTSPAAADGIAAGEWKLTETMVMNGNKTPPQTRTRCLSAEQAGDTATTFSPEYRTVNSG